jgi:hypothetical protein
VLDFHRTPKRSLSIAGRGPTGDEPSRSGGILLRTVAAGMSQWWKRELVLTEEGLEWDAWNYQRLVKMTLPYDAIGAVSVLWGPYADDVRVVGKSQSDSMLVRGLDKASAARVKAIVDRRIGALFAA